MVMNNPTHPGETIRDSINELGWTVTEAAKRIGVSRNTLSRVLNGRGGISPEMALSLEQLGWSNADFWVRRQAGYELAQARRKQNAA